MELIEAIVLVCSFNLGNAQVSFPETINQAMVRQQKCQTELSKCIVSRGYNTQNSLIICIGKRK